MGRIVVSTNATFDGITQDPTGEEGFRFGGWFELMPDADREAWAKTEFDEAMAAHALLLGGRTYEWFAQRWVGREGAWGERLTALPKYVVRSTPGRSDWGPTTVLGSDTVAAVRGLKDTVPGDIVVYASYQLVHTLFDNDLVDEIRLFVFPHIIGSGGRLFAELTQAKPLRLTHVSRVGDTLVNLTYLR